MKIKLIQISIFIFSIFIYDASAQSVSREVHQDVHFTQEYAIIYSTPLHNLSEFSLAADENGVVQILNNNQLLRPSSGHFQDWGTLVADQSYLPMKDKNISAISSYKEQIVYLDDQALFSNAWAGSLYIKHDLGQPDIFEGGENFDFLIAEGKTIQYLKNKQGNSPAIQIPGNIVSIKFDSNGGLFYMLTAEKVFSFNPKNQEIKEEFSHPGMTALDFFLSKKQLIVGTSIGYFTYDIITKVKSPIIDELPALTINTIKSKGDDIWFGTDQGAFVIDGNDEIRYYYLERWLPGERVFDLEIQDNSVTMLTDNGLGIIMQEEMTLAEKAEFYEKSLRKNHLRNGFNASLILAESGKIETGRLKDSDNDGLWTSMYLASQGFRYAVTEEQEALDQVRQSLLAMERLYTINPVPGFPSRSFERSGYIEILSDPERWQPTEDPEWDWKTTTSSDEVIGHVFVFSVLAEVVKDKWVREKSIELLDTLMSHIIKNDMYLVDFDGKPTLWGKWHPDYVNSFPTTVGDRKLNSSNSISMLQTAYHFTGKEKYKQKALELMNDYGYLENLMRPMAIIGMSGGDSDSYAQMLSESWNHSDDEMYFLGYWGLYKYALNDELKADFKKSILDHWEAERPEKDGLWNISTALVQPESFDLGESIWWLQKHPLDLIQWNVKNSHRKDIEILPPNFRRQSTPTVLTPAETRIARHNGNRFDLDNNGNGKTAYSPGDIWLLPYWMGRYFEVID
ncbi:hypothetical protein LV84_02848 [Algoriphagus ratkowskyi]|uniref:Uncharacterized protein n=1 Tax=Algoriphagus ratkowskyi TaxID=57028 RepID=A0A2W7RUW5_9BACT|nr:hypothetical protein [Algoriphagus ratkowskyi]PZX54695.1 hypothetical protein LV84_02848 [Algoriphagus ratkowskyi]TXD77006.1 hypothetical protein ESW18_14460 [Algoriphagus ratkowskyi]